MSKDRRAAITPTQINPEMLYPVTEAIRLIGVSRSSLTWLRATGKIETTRWLRRGVRVKGSELLRFLATCDAPASESKPSNGPTRESEGRR
jgi:hypothetical protein